MKKKSSVKKALQLNSCAVELLENGKVVDRFEMNDPSYISDIKGKENFAGIINYTFEFEAKFAYARILPEGVMEAATVYVNDKTCGTVISGRYEYETRDLKEGMNKIVVSTNTSLGRKMGDFCSQFIALEPTGITGIRIIC